MDFHTLSTGDRRTKLFISNCGMNGVNEAVYHGIPIVCMPIFADQVDNAKRIIDRGLGLVLDKDHETADSFFLTVQEVIQNPKQV